MINLRKFCVFLAVNQINSFKVQIRHILNISLVDTN